MFSDTHGGWLGLAEFVGVVIPKRDLWVVFGGRLLAGKKLHRAFQFFKNVNNFTG